MGFVLLDIQFYMYVLWIVVCPFVLFLLAIVLFIPLRFTYSNYPFGIFKLFLPYICIGECSLFLPCQCFQQMSLCCTCLPPTSIVGCLLDSIVPSTCTCFTSFPCQSKTTAHLHRQCSKMMVLCCTCSQRTSIVSCLLEIPINPVYRVDKAYSYNVKLSSGCSLLTVHQFQRI